MTAERIPSTAAPRNIPCRPKAAANRAARGGRHDLAHAVADPLEDALRRRGELARDVFRHVGHAADEEQREPDAAEHGRGQEHLRRGATAATTERAAMHAAPKTSSRSEPNRAASHGKRSMIGTSIAAAIAPPRPTMPAPAPSSSKRNGVKLRTEPSRASPGTSRPGTGRARAARRAARHRGSGWTRFPVTSCRPAVSGSAR